MKGNPPCGQNIKQYTWFITLLGSKNGQMCNRSYVLIHGQGLRRNMMGQLVKRKSEEKVRGWTSPNGQKLCVSCECLPNGDCSRGGF